MKRVILESPYHALTDDAVMDNVVYARACLCDCLARDESPIVSHLLYPYTPSSREIRHALGFDIAPH